VLGALRRRTPPFASPSEVEKRRTALRLTGVEMDARVLNEMRIATEKLHELGKELAEVKEKVKAQKMAQSALLSKHTNAIVRANERNQDLGFFAQHDLKCTVTARKPPLNPLTEDMVAAALPQVLADAGIIDNMPESKSGVAKVAMAVSRKLFSVDVRGTKPAFAKVAISYAPRHGEGKGAPAKKTKEGSSSSSSSSSSTTAAPSTTCVTDYRAASTESAAPPAAAAAGPTGPAARRQQNGNDPCTQSSFLIIIIIIVKRRKDCASRSSTSSLHTATSNSNTSAATSVADATSLDTRSWPLIKKKQFTKSGTTTTQPYCRLGSRVVRVRKVGE